MKNIFNKFLARVVILALPIFLIALSSWGQTTTVLTLDCATPAPTGSTSTAFSNTSDVATFLNSAAGLSSAANKITCSEKTGDVYKGKGSGGGSIPQQCLKVGKASGPGSITFTIPETYDPIDKVDIQCYGWKTSSSISVNGGTPQTFTTAQTETTKSFDLASSSRTITIAVTASAVCITEIVLKKTAGSTPTCAAPTFSPAAGAVLSGTTVTLSTATDGASIYYTMGAAPADPTTSSTPYSTPISITENTTIKAIAVKDGYDNSTVSSAAYSLLTPVTTMDAIFAAATSAGSTATPIAITFDNWVVTGVSGNNAYVTDGTKGFIVFQSGHGFSVGNVLSGTAACKVQLYKGASELTQISSTTTGLAVSDGGVINPVTNVTIDNLSGVNTGAVFSYENLTYNSSSQTLSDGVNVLKPYTTLFDYGSTFENGKAYNITGVYLQFNNNNVETKEILPRSAADIEEVVAAEPTILTSVNSLSGFTYQEGNGPSEANSFTVSGSSLTSAISLSVSGSDFEISLTEDSGYTSALELTPTTGTVTNTTIYARLKSGKSSGNYNATITLVSTGATDKTVSLTGTVTGTPITSLPFAFDEGKNAIAIKSGLSHSGLGDDYNSSPKLKFDTTGDFLLLQFNERPGVLTYHIKGNGFSSGSTSTFKVQASVDGESYTDLKTYTELSEEDETIDDLSENVRYIKWVYTEKGASNGGNVALGNIALAKYVDPLTIPSISLDSYTIDAPAAETNGTLVITYNNLAVSDKSDFAIQYYDDGDNEIPEPAWIEILVADQDPGIGEGYVVSYYILDNDGTARNAYFKVYAMDNETNLVYSDLVTVTQAKANPIPSGWEEETLDALTEDDVFVIVGINNAGDCFAMSNDNGTSDAPAAVELTGTIPNNVKWNIGGDAVNGYVFYPNGTTEKWLYCTDTNNGVRVGTNANNAFTLSKGYLLNDATSRYVGVYNAQDWRCYGTNGGNIANQTFKFYKRVVSNTVEPTITVTATESDGRFWATFYNAEAQYVLPEGAQAFTMNVDKELYRVGKDGRVIPENTPVIIIADKASLTLTQKNAGDGTIHDDALSPVNILRGSSSAVATSSITPGTPYVLGIVGGKLGFYEYTGLNIPANKAYYVVE